MLASLLLILPLKDQQQSSNTQKLATFNPGHKPSLTIPTEEESITPNDRAVVRSVIAEQLAALQQDDAEGAFAFASPAIQSQFRTPENFLAMVKSSYPLVYRPRSVTFEKTRIVEDVLVQEVVLQGAEGESVTALYLMQKQPDGSWRIDGCFLAPTEGQSI